MQYPKLTRISPVRLAFVFLGAGFVALGWYAWSHEIYWVTVYNARVGQFGWLPTIILAFIGVVIVLGALLLPEGEGMPTVGTKRRERKRQLWLKREKYWKRMPPQ